MPYITSNALTSAHALSSAISPHSTAVLFARRAASEIFRVELCAYASKRMLFFGKSVDLHLLSATMPLLTEQHFVGAGQVVSN